MREISMNISVNQRIEAYKTADIDIYFLYITNWHEKIYS